MKKTLLISILAMLGLTQAAAQEYEYVPFVREGVKWVYYYINEPSPVHGVDPDLALGKVFLTLEFKGDTVIGGKTYKAMHKYYGNSINNENDTIPVYLREDNKVVYGIMLGGPESLNRDCFLGYGFDDIFFLNIWDGNEFVLYDFNDTQHYYESFFNSSDSDPNNELLSFLYSDTITLGNKPAKRNIFKYRFNNICFIEGIGYDGQNSGYPLAYMYSELMSDPPFHLSHVIEAGQIIYKGMCYSPDNMTGIDEVVADQRPRHYDDNYYNLMGQPVGKDIPSTPGIYIHHGKKIVINY
jgi:hypothetical protein